MRRAPVVRRIESAGPRARRRGGTVRRAARVAQGGAQPTRRRPPRRARTGSPRTSVASRRRRARDARDDVDEEAAAGPRRRPGASLAGPSREDRADLAALGADARDEERQARARSTGSPRELGRRRAADDQRRPSRRAPAPRPAGATRRWSGSAGRSVAGVRGDDQVLELAGARVGGPAQDVGEAVGALEQRRDRLAARGTG